MSHYLPQFQFMKARNNRNVRSNISSLSLDFRRDLFPSLTVLLGFIHKAPFHPKKSEKIKIEKVVVIMNKRILNIINRYEKSEITELEQIYKNPSKDKQLYFNAVKASFIRFNGLRLRIISYNNYTFTMGYIYLAKNGEKYLMYYTPYKTDAFLLRRE